MKEPITIGQRIVAAVIAHQLGISSDRALKLYVRGRELDPSWEEVGKTLLANERASTTVPASARPALGPQIVLSEFDSRKAAAIEAIKENAKALGLRRDSHMLDLAQQYIVAIDAWRKGNAS